MIANSTNIRFIVRFVSIVLLSFLAINTSIGQTYSYVKGGLKVNVFVSNPCSGSTTNGFLRFDVVTAGGGSAVLVLIAGPNTTDFPGQSINAGSSFTYTPVSPQAGNYDFVIHDLAIPTNNTINTFASVTPVSMVDLPNIVINQVTLTNNSDCTTPNGQAVASVSGGSKSPALAVPGSFTYTWTSNNGLAGLPLTNTFDGTGNLDLASLLSRPGLPGGTYALSIVDNYSVCTQTQNFVLTDPSPIVYNVTTTTPSICIGSGGTVNLLNSEGAVLSYEVYKGGVATGITLPGVNGPLAFTIPSGLLTPASSYNFTIRAVNGFCSPVFMNGTASITVTPNNTVSAASSSPTLCINTTLTAITHTTTGATGIGVATGLPAGVTAAWASNTITIGGTPTVSGTFNYSIPLTGGCGPVLNATGTITVTPDNTVSVASSSPTLCINTALTAITHTTTGATGIGAATGLPAGVTAAWASNTITISGTPTVSGTFNYSIPLTGGCGPVLNATGTITVTPNNTVSAASSSPTLCINTALTAITHTTTGATGIGVATGLPAGVTAAWASNTITISGTPTVSGTFNYSIPLTGGCGPVLNATGTITVTPDNTVSAASSSPTLCINTALTAITHTTTGATGIGVATGLPAGVTAAWASNTITISGTPTVSGTFNYSIPLTGGCGPVLNATGTITVTSDNTVSAASSSPTLCINTALTAITHTTTGATGIGVATGLPAGVTAAWASNTITISGTPTASGTFNYSIPLTGGCGIVSATGTITVTPDNTVSAASSSPTLCINTALTAITHTTTGATGIGAATGLPAGVTAAWASNTITISGTPTVSGTFNYSIPLTGGCGPVLNATGTITVTPDNTVSAASSSPTLCINTALTAITHTTTGATGIGAATGLPAGVTAAWASNTITISGTPTVSGTFNYSIPLTGGCGIVNATGTITVILSNTVSAASSSPTLCINTALTAITHTTTGATGIGAATGLPAGVTAAWASNTITISGTATVSGTFNYSIPLTGGCGPVLNATGTITVTPDNTVSAASSSPTLCINTALTAITHTTTGATGIGVATGLPAGVTAAWASNTITISGTPTVSGTFNYSIPLTGGCGPVLNATGTITVTPAPDATINPAGPFCLNAAATNLTAVTPGGTWSGAGITDTSLGTFDPSVAGVGVHSITYSVTVGGCTSTKSRNIRVNAVPNATITPSGPFCLSDPTTNLTAATGGGTWSGTGIVNAATGAFDPATAGVGTFTITYSVTVSGCTDTKTTSITVGNSPDATITPAGPFCTNTAPVTLTAATAGGTWSGTGITNTATGTFNPATAGAGTFTITYSITTGGCSDTKNTSITVNTAPNATITPAGPFCTTDAPVTLTAATGGGTWSGTGITNTATGAFDPATAGPGTFSISYSVTLGSCTDSKSINITVAAPPDATITPAGPFCTNTAPVTLTAATAGGTWSGTGITNTATGTFDPATAGAGTFTITYSITIGGCSDTKTTSITVNTAPNATITPAGPFCTTDAPVTLTAATGGGTWSGTGITNTATGAFDPATAGPGTFSISYSVTLGSCTDSKSINITVANPPDATITPAGPFCTNTAPVTLTAATAGGTWSGTGITNTATGTFNPATAGAGTFTITYSITIGGCSDTKTTSITVNTAPNATITPAGPFCTTDAPVTLTAATGGGTWSGTGITNTATGAFDPATAGPGTFSISYSVTLGSCTDSKSINITVAAPPDATITPAGPFCTNTAPVTLTAATAGGTWSGTGITNTATGTFNPATAGAGTFTITYSITIGGCSDTKTTSITVNSAPSATITPAGPFCITSPATNLTASVPGGTWSGAGITNAATGTFDPSVSGAGSFTITYSVTSGSCTTNATTTIQVNASCGTNCGAFTSISATDTRPTCSGQDDGTITISVSGGAPNYVVTLSDPSQGFSQAMVGGSGPFTFGAGPSGGLSPSLTYQYTVLDGVGNTCTLPYSLPIQTNVQATAAGFVDAKCFNQAVGQATITVNSGGTSPYEYSLDAGATWISFTSPVTITNLMPAPSPYSILVRDDASDLCPAQVSVTINNAVTDITTTFTNADATCNNNDGTVQVGPVSGGTAPYTYRFDGTDYATLPANNTFTGLVGGPHTFTVIDAIGCSKDFVTTINFPGLVNFTTSVSNPDCSGNGNNGSIFAVITSLGTFDVGIRTLNDPTIFQRDTVVSSGSAVVPFYGLPQGYYYIVAKPLGALCPSTSPLDTIRGGPVAVDFTIIPEDFICFETPDKDRILGRARITGITGSQADSYIYQIISAGGIIQSDTIKQFQALPFDTINFSLDKGNYQMIMFQDQSVSSGCGPLASHISSAYKSFSIYGPSASLDTLSVQRQYKLHDSPTVSVLIDIKESYQEPYQLRLKLTAGRTRSDSLFDTGFVNVPKSKDQFGNDQFVFAANVFAGDYQLSISDSLGCTRNYDLNIGFKEIFIPNVFTPNNDGANDTFEILNLPVDSTPKLVISNRWGKEVYQSSNYQNNWNGGPEVDGIYYYTLTLGGKTYTGWVEILHPTY